MSDERRINTALTRARPSLRASEHADEPRRPQFTRPAMVLVRVQTLSGVIQVLDLFFLALAVLFFLAAWGLSGLLGRL